MSVNVAKANTVHLPAMKKYSDVFIAVGAVIIIGMMIIPMSPIVLDVLLTVNITAALTILLVTTYTTEALQFSAFPATLLLTTLFRLSLNVSATRLILLHASAGSVIGAFGNVVVGGNYVVGIVVFAILIIIQFVVVTNGTSRVAEVAARFTLDAMPGKQMAIDADLNAGLIDEEQARQRRIDVAREADFYGAMDGASKFVRGDTIAAIIMILVNIIGGFIIGITQRHMDFTAALQTYTLLTIGQGLVTQIPALLVSSAAGLMVTKTTSEYNLGVEVGLQLFTQPKALGITAGACCLLAIIPGLPKIPFLLAAAIGGVMAYAVKTRNEKRIIEPEPVREAPRAPENMTDLLTVDPIEVELGYGLIVLADPKQGGDLLDRITAVRRQAALDLGLLVPAIRVRDNMRLKANNYVIKLRGVEVARGEIYTGHLLAMNSGAAAGKLQGIETTEPAFGLPATWISDLQQSEAEMMGFTVIDPLTVMITHITETLKKHAADILTRQDTQALVDTVKNSAPAVVEELIPSLLSLGDVQKVLQNLLSERVSVKDMASILEALADTARVTKDTDILTEFVRQALCRQITAQHQSPDGTVKVFAFDPSVEQKIAESVRQTDAGAQLVLDPDTAQKILESTREEVERMAALGHQPVALSSTRTRMHLRRLIERMIPTLAVISYNELAPGVKLETLGMVTITDENAQDQIG